MAICNKLWKNSVYSYLVLPVFVHRASKIAGYQKVVFFAALLERSYDLKPVLKYS